MDLVHKNGFVGCDSAIKQQFKSYMESGDGRVSIDYFEKNGKTFSIMATWGKVGDSIMQHTVFEKSGTVCYAYQLSQISTEESCDEYKEANPVWKYVDSKGDYLWTKNSGGVDALMKRLPNGGCYISYNVSNKYSVD